MVLAKQVACMSAAICGVRRKYEIPDVAWLIGATLAVTAIPHSKRLAAAPEDTPVLSLIYR
jgi:hypothetical protein